ncbi:hypothetical protein K7W03_10115 [Sphingobium sp. PNB]|uniref:hypothetical protein n=1 Tax=Sphingobium sp. PNB TaxID=863934 RepID=UPI001CA4541D|nr:hypothetical protein [Sphingobium sp. PNB]MCB4859949.1 hypothetical protein [Sphingobium sp. PNB]
MKPLTMEEKRELRASMASLDLSDDKIDEWIQLVDYVAISFIDQEFGWSAERISLSTRANRALSSSDSCPRVPASGTFSHVDDRPDGAAKPMKSTDEFTP